MWDLFGANFQTELHGDQTSNHKENVLVIAI